MGYPNKQDNPAAAIPVYMIGGGGGTIGGGSVTQLDYQQIDDLTTAKALTVPAGTQYAIISTEDGSARWRADGTDPTASVGQILWATAAPIFAGAAFLAALKFINMSGNTSKLNVTYMGVAP